LFLLYFFSQRPRSRNRRVDAKNGPGGQDMPGKACRASPSGARPAPTVFMYRVDFN